MGDSGVGDSDGNGRDVNDLGEKGLGGDGNDTAATRRSRAIAAVGLTVELVTVAGLVGLGVYGEVKGQMTTATSGWAVTGFLALVAVGLAAVLVAVVMRRRWATAPAITVQLIMLVVFVWPLVASGVGWLGAVVAVVAVVTLVSLIVQAKALPAPPSF